MKQKQNEKNSCFHCKYCIKVKPSEIKNFSDELSEELKREGKCARYPEHMRIKNIQSHFCGELRVRPTGKRRRTN